MAAQRFTRCPGCATVFRVTEGQLALRAGQVRCGHCRAVFDANDHFVSLDAGTAPDALDAPDELMAGRPTVTLRSADALQPVHPMTPEKRAGIPQGDASADTEPFAVEAPDNESTTDEFPADESRADERPAGEEPTGEGATGEGTQDGPTVDDVIGETVSASTEAPAAWVAPVDPNETGRAERFEWKKRNRSGRPRKTFYLVAIVVLVMGLALQALAEFRDALAAHVPATRPLLARACRAFGCTIDPLRDTAALSIDASDLQADPAHRGLLLLTATLRNRAGHPIAYPHLELTLTDSSDRIVVRRAFAPADYAGGTAEPREGIPPNGERVVRLFIDASATQQAGYRLYLFYP